MKRVRAIWLDHIIHHHHHHHLFAMVFDDRAYAKEVEQLLLITIALCTYTHTHTLTFFCTDFVILYWYRLDCRQPKFNNHLFGNLNLKLHGFFSSISPPQSETSKCVCVCVCLYLNGDIHKCIFIYLYLFNFVGVCVFGAVSTTHTHTTEPLKSTGHFFDSMMILFSGAKIEMRISKIHWLTKSWESKCYSSYALRSVTLLSSIKAHKHIGALHFLFFFFCTRFSLAIYWKKKLIPKKIKLD